LHHVTRILQVDVQVVVDLLGVRRHQQQGEVPLVEYLGNDGRAAIFPRPQLDVAIDPPRLGAPLSMGVLPLIPDPGQLVDQELPGLKLEVDGLVRSPTT
jgi:hypothetical protein